MSPVERLTQSPLPSGQSTIQEEEGEEEEEGAEEPAPKQQQQQQQQPASTSNSSSSSGSSSSSSSVGADGMEFSSSVWQLRGNKAISSSSSSSSTVAAAAGSGDSSQQASGVSFLVLCDPKFPQVRQLLAGLDFAFPEANKVRVTAVTPEGWGAALLLSLPVIGACSMKW